MKIKIISVGIAVLMFALFATCVTAAPDLFTAAVDVSGDGRVTSTDARILLRRSAGLEQLQETAAAKAARVLVFGDCNGDGKVNSSDARMVLRYAARLIDQSQFILPVEPPPTTNNGELVDNPTKPDTPEIPDLPKNELLSPYRNHGLGTAAMVISKADFAEMTPANVENFRSYPLMNPYISGTIDYVAKKATYYNTDCYVLKSGAKIETEDAAYLSSGYVLPQNTIAAAGVYFTAAQTEIYIKTTWQVPVCVQFKPQTYFSGYEGRPYNLSSFTAEYMEVQFSYTGSASGEFAFPDGSVFRSASWSTAQASETTALRLYFSEIGKFYGYTLSMTENGYFKIVAKNINTGLTGKTIVLDPGHGGSDPGGGSAGIYEVGINLKTANYLKEMLEDAGAKVVMTRESDKEEVSLEDRVQITRKNQADLFLSIHCDVAESKTAAGVSVYYYYPYSMPYAKCLQNGLVEAYRVDVYDAASANFSKIDRDIKFYPFYVARNEICPAVLIELGFLSNADERAALQTESTQRALAKGIYNGIVDYYS